MKAFWWFEEDFIAGMARPGFNSFHFMDLEFNEAVVLGWLGQYSSGSATLESLRHHLQTYVPKMFKFHQLNDESGQKMIEIFNQRSGLELMLERTLQKVPVIQNLEITDDSVHFSIHPNRLMEETDFLKRHNIRRIITLTEKHHSKDFLQDHFDLHHLSIEDLGAPSFEQAEHLAEIVKKARIDQEKLAVHCLAGIGRTSTMLMAAYILLGEKLEHMKAKIAKQNPRFILTGVQKEFLEQISK